jgi:hypothetical protein
MHIFTEAEKDFLKEFVPGHSYQEIQKEFSDVFQWGISIGQVKGAIARYRLNTGRNGRFQKGHKAHNKGIKMSPETYEKVKRTMFGKGHMPVQYRPVGSERVSVDGYVEIKVKDPNKWRLKHNVVWEEANGKIPKGYVVIFLDRNPLNTDISNLKMIKRSELLIMNRYKILGEDIETMEAAVNLAKLIDSTNRRKNER